MYFCTTSAASSGPMTCASYLHWVASRFAKKLLPHDPIFIAAEVSSKVCSVYAIV